MNYALKKIFRLLSFVFCLLSFLTFAKNQDLL